jgi:hypothetical protein
MCAISGAPTLVKAFELYQNGLERGHYSSGLIFIFKNDSLILKQKESFEYEALVDTLSKKEQSDIVYCAFHSRAPTNVVQGEWEYDSTHPFNFENYYVAHNGIINNFNKFPEHAEFDVDSSIIPYHLYNCGGDISEVYDKYTGLLTSWIFDIVENKFNLIKAGSSLFRDKDSFSSVKFSGAVCIERDGVIFELGKDRALHEVADFNYTSPYFII